MKPTSTMPNTMPAAYGKDFAMGAPVLAARFIAESEARARAAAEAGCSPSTASHPTP